MPASRVVISVCRGMVQEVYSDGEIDVAVVDWDTEGASPSDAGIVEVRRGNQIPALAAVLPDVPSHPLANLHPDVADELDRDE